MARNALKAKAAEMFERGTHTTIIADTLQISQPEVLNLLQEEYEAGTVGDYYLTREEMEAA